MKEQYQKSYFRDYFKANKRITPVVGADLATWPDILPTPAQYSTHDQPPSMLIILL